MRISFTENRNGERPVYQARVEGSFSTGDSAGDCCLTAYGETREEAHAHLRQLALQMVRELDELRRP